LYVLCLPLTEFNAALNIYLVPTFATVARGALPGGTAVVHSVEVIFFRLSGFLLNSFNAGETQLRYNFHHQNNAFFVFISPDANPASLCLTFTFIYLLVYDISRYIFLRSAFLIDKVCSHYGKKRSRRCGIRAFSRLLLYSLSKLDMQMLMGKLMNDDFSLYSITLDTCH
jgi:hypothetical protein